MMVGGEGSSGTKGEGETGMLKKGPWTAAEDAILMDYVRKNGEGNWNAVQKNSGLLRCGKSCRLRWANHLRPNLKKGSFSPEEERLILQLHSKLGNKWARMATHLPGRTDNEIKNYWNTRIKRRQRAGLPLYPPDIQHNQCQLSPVRLRTEIKPQFGQNTTPLSLFDPLPINYSSTTTAPVPLIGHSSFRSCDPQQFFSHQQHLKRTREDNLVFPAMEIAGGSTSTASAAIPMAVPMVRFGSSKSSHSFLPQNYSPFSINVELPSSQYLPVSADDHDDLWDRNNSGLLDALLENTEGSSEKIAACEISMEIFLPNTNKKEEIEDVKCSGERSGTYYCLTDAKMKAETPVNAITEDLSAVFDFMPPTTTDTATATTWLKNNGAGEISNGQSSGVTEDEISLEMQHLASHLSIAGEDQDQTWKNIGIGSDQWVNMPGIAELGQIP